MKKALCGLLTAVLLVPLIASAVQWGPANSNQFRWPFVGTAGDNLMKATQTALQCRFNAAKGIVTFHYTIPSITKGAALNIYSVNGVLITTFNLQPGSNTIQWSIAQNKVAAGIYVASLRIGTVEKNIQISLVK